MNLPDDIRGDLKRVARQQPLFTLLNYFKGVPISHGASLKRFDLTSATLGIHPHQAVCAKAEGRTRIQSKLLSLAILAEAKVDVATNTAKLTGFKRVSYLTERRQFVRIEPYQRIGVEVYAQNWTVHGHLEDMSVMSIGLFLPGEEIFFEPEVVFKEFASVKARVNLPGIDAPVELNGIVARGFPLENHNYRLGVRLSPNAQVQKVIREYIQRQQANAEQELQALYEQMRQG